MICVIKKKAVSLQHIYKNVYETIVKFVADCIFQRRYLCD